MKYARIAGSFSVFLGLSLSVYACGGDDTVTPISADAGHVADSSSAVDGTTPGTDSSTPDMDTGAAADTSTGTDTGTGGDTSTGTDAADANTDDGGPQTHVVTVGAGGLNFSPSTLTIKANDSVQWTWSSSGHTVTSGTGGTADNKFCSPSDGNACGAAATSNSGFTYTHKFTTAGTFPYFCIPHVGAGMTGTITVQ